MSAKPTEGGKPASNSESSAIPPSDPSGHLPLKGGDQPGRSLFAKPDLDSMGPGTDMTRPARKPSSPGEAGEPTNFRKPTLEDIGHNIAVPARPEANLFRKNTLDEMTVGRTEKPLNTSGKLPEKPVLRTPSSPQRGDSPQEAKPIGTANLVRGSSDAPKPFIRAKSGAGSYEDAGDAKRQKRTKGKTGRPGQ